MEVRIAVSSLGSVEGYNTKVGRAKGSVKGYNAEVVRAKGSVEGYNAEVGCARVRLLAPVKAGQQVFVYYGNLSSASQLIRFGFCDMEHQEDSVPFELDQEGITPLQQAALEKWRLRADTQQLLRKR
ncbi:hypothetical protein T484DRAFT_1797456 [Baffinella frigidus]|nr:hypothetical protein T484DRAFT_1797456 [Cryptophyta sp. CCMP2293]